MPVLFLGNPLIAKTLAIFAVLILTLQTQDQWIYVTAFALAHYLLSFIYSVKNLGFDKKNIKPLLGLLALIVISWYAAHHYQSYILLIFGWHHVMSETFFLRTVQKDSNKPAIYFWYMTAFFSHSALFLYLVQEDPFFVALAPTMVVTWIGIISATLFVAQTFLMQELKQQERLQAISFLLLGLLFIGFENLFPDKPLALIHIILYHIFYWTLIPLSKMPSTKQISIYSLLTLLGFAGFYWWMKDEFYASKDHWHYYVGLFLTWGFFHIITSIALSKDNPAFVNRFFNWIKRA